MADQNPKNLDINIADLHKRLEDREELVKPIKGADGSYGPYMGSFVCQPCHICTLCTTPRLKA
jgi:hypothetical protein